MNTGRRINLFCFPFAGGSVYSYRPFLSYCPPDINIVPLELPGRGRRTIEPLLTCIDEMVDDMYSRIKSHLSEPYAFYGHSMGTVLALRTAWKIREEGLTMPLSMIMSGRGGPSNPEPVTCRSDLPREEFFLKLRELGGSPDEVFSNEEVKSYFEPILRADFKALENYNYQPHNHPVSVPFAVMVGNEEGIALEKAMLWQQETTFQITVNTYSGGHFFIFDQPHAIVPEITRYIRRSNAM